MKKTLVKRKRSPENNSLSANHGGQHFFETLAPNYFSAATALRFLKQVHGSTMGGPLSATFSNIYIGGFFRMSQTVKLEI